MAYKKEKKIKVDIILPNFNSAEYIKETIKSILNQSFKNWNLIIVDDCSDTKTKNIAICPGAAVKGKQWKLENFIEVAKFTTNSFVCKIFDNESLYFP